MTDGDESQKTVVKSGAAQGSVIAPVLFLIFLYISDIDQNLQYCKASSFTDDTRLLDTVKCERDFYTHIDLQTICN